MCIALATNVVVVVLVVVVVVVVVVLFLLLLLLSLLLCTCATRGLQAFGGSTSKLQSDGTGYRLDPLLSCSKSHTSTVFMFCGAKLKPLRTPNRFRTDWAGGRPSATRGTGADPGVETRWNRQ